MKIRYTIEPLLNPCLSCSQITMATIALHYRRRYELILSETWGFAYEDKEAIFGESLQPGYQGRRRELLEKYHGIRITDWFFDSKKELCDNIFFYVAHYGPLLLQCDIYNCSWNMAYRRDHVKHYIIITGANDQNSVVTILDPFTSEKEYEVDLMDVANEKGTLGYFEVIGPEAIAAVDIRNELLNTINYISSVDMFDKMNSFYQTIPDKLCFEAVSIEDVYAVPLVFNLYRIMNQRYCFLLFLRFAHDYRVIDEDIISDMQIVAEKYKLLRMVAIKTILQEKHTDILKSVVSDIVYREKTIYKKLVHYLQSEG